MPSENCDPRSAQMRQRSLYEILSHGQWFHGLLSQGSCCVTVGECILCMYLVIYFTLCILAPDVGPVFKDQLEHILLQ